MTEQFNRILQAFGANRVKLEEFDNDSGYIHFELLHWGKFCVWHSGHLEERLLNGHYKPTANSRWLHAISLGKKRDDEGRVG